MQFHQNAWLCLGSEAALLFVVVCCDNWQRRLQYISFAAEMGKANVVVSGGVSGRRHNQAGTTTDTAASPSLLRRTPSQFDDFLEDGTRKSRQRATRLCQNCCNSGGGTGGGGGTNDPNKRRLGATVCLVKALKFVLKNSSIIFLAVL